MELEVLSWNLTRACNLSCAHCYLPAGTREDRSGELSTSECRRVIDQIGEVASRPMLILTGGEPLLREDIFDIARYASAKGITVVVGTNGTQIDESVLSRLMESGVQGLGISLDSLRPEVHDSFRGATGAWEKTVASVELAGKLGLPFTVQTTVLTCPPASPPSREGAGWPSQGESRRKANRQELPALADFSYKAGARAFNIFFLVCTGRGQEMTDITPEEYEETLGLIADMEKEFAGRMLIKAKCAPHVNRVRYEKGLWKEEEQNRGCPAGTSYLRITADGKVTPCPYIQKEVGDLRVESMSRIWEGSPELNSLRQWSLKGRCGQCEFISLCGGCRARALAASGDIFAEDPWCKYKPGQYQEDRRLRPREKDKECGLNWQPDARERLKEVPAFIRGMVTRRVEDYAREKGYNEITVELMREVREKFISFMKKGG